MGKKVREYKSGDFIFAKVKGYPAWPARVQRLNGKKYFVYFYGTGETANLPPNMIFDYAENKDKFLTKTQKRRDFNDGVKQIEHDFANNVPLEEVIGAPIEVGAGAPADDTANDSVDDTLNETAAADTTTANDTADDETINATLNDTAIEDSDENGALIIDEGKTGKSKKSKVDAKAQAKEIPKAAPKTPRGKPKKDDAKDKEDDVDANEEVVSRSGRKIRPKRYMDEQTEENATLPSPAPKRRRGVSPAVDKEKDTEREKGDFKDKNIKHFNAVTQSELEELKEPFKQDADKENILMAYLPNGKYVGIKLFQSRPASFKSDSSRLQWDKQAASNAITLKMQLERGHITALSVQGQLVMDLNLTDEEKATLDKERETEEKKFRVQFLKAEMKLIELDAKIKTCLSLEKADTDLCLKLLDDFIGLEVKPLMLLKHPGCLETIKRMRAYVGNTPSWDLSESAAVVFSKQAHKIRKQADIVYKNIKNVFTTPDGLSFWEHFSERLMAFKKVAAKLSASELLEMVYEPLEMSQPTSHTMRAAIDAANEEDGEPPKKRAATGKTRSRSSMNNTPTRGKRHSSRKAEEEKTDEPAQKEAEDTPNTSTEDAPPDEMAKEADKPAEQQNENVEMAEAEPSKAAEETTSEKDKETEIPQENNKTDKSKDKKGKNAKEGKKSPRNAEKSSKEVEKSTKEVEKVTKEAESSSEKDPIVDETPKDSDSPKDSEAVAKKSAKTEKSPKKDKNPIPESTSDTEKSPKQEKNLDGPQKDPEVSSTQEEPDSSEDKLADVKNKKVDKNGDKSADSEKSAKELDSKECEKRKVDDKAHDDKDSGEPRAKRSRESKKTEPPPPRSPAKRKSKY